jgi:hypothetical protein
VRKNFMTLRLSFLFLCLLCISCQRKETGTQAETLVQTFDTTAKTRVQTDVRLSDSTTPAINTNIGSNTPVVPVTAVGSQAMKVLFTGTFHRDEVEEGVGNLPWLALFHDDSEGFVLRKTKIIARRVVDGLLDDEEKGERTGWEIATENDEHPTMLISSGDLTEGKVHAGEVPSVLYPGDSAQFEFKGVRYLLYATGMSQMDSLRGITYVSDYSLYIVKTENGKTTSTLVASHANFDDAMTAILWSGDLDRDGYIDFLIDMSRHYNQRLPTLFLSKPAGEGSVVVPVAEHSSVGC